MNEEKGRVLHFTALTPNLHLLTNQDEPTVSTTSPTALIVFQQDVCHPQPEARDKRHAVDYSLSCQSTHYNHNLAQCQGSIYRFRLVTGCHPPSECPPKS
ncbi:hypothetical protein OS493_005417 [Desmophyllum pertusum]|uniref:Uncharacterized protein n=1 Tax=Desmophyllum pertusum TaxID=174260 RepID=A0A9W9YSB1_9CNID|nr:hypothetical protein OS493_005417 [Desmophyllum pertusum]